MLLASGKLPQELLASLNFVNVRKTNINLVSEGDPVIVVLTEFLRTTNSTTTVD